MGKTTPTDKVLERKPAHELLVDFIKFNNLVLIVDEVTDTVPSIPDHLYVVNKSPRVRVFYADQVEKGGAKAPIDLKNKGKALNG